MHLASRISSKNIDPYKTLNGIGILLHIWRIGTIKNDNVSLLSKSLYTKTPYPTLISRYKNDTWFP